MPSPATSSRSIRAGTASTSSARDSVTAHQPSRAGSRRVAPPGEDSAAAAQPELSGPPGEQRGGVQVDTDPSAEVGGDSARLGPAPRRGRSRADRRACRSGTPARSHPNPAPPRPRPHCVGAAAAATSIGPLELQGGESPVQHLPVGVVGRVHQRPELQRPAAAAGQRPSPARRGSRCTACRPRAPVRCGHRTSTRAPSPGSAWRGSPARAPARWCGRRTPGAGHRPANHGASRRC